MEEIKISSDEDPKDKCSFDKDKFLFFFKPEECDKECVFGISLLNGIKIFSIVSMLQAISAFMDIFQSNSLLKTCGILFLVAIYVLIALFAFWGATQNDTNKLKCCYWTASVLFILSALTYLCKSILRIVEFINPFNGDFLNFGLWIYILGTGVYLFIYLYFIWIVYCFITQS